MSEKNKENICTNSNDRLRKCFLTLFDFDFF